jgi:hypothetical protein
MLNKVPLLFDVRDDSALSNALRPLPKNPALPRKDLQASRRAPTRRNLQWKNDEVADSVYAANELKNKRPSIRSPPARFRCLPSRAPSSRPSGQALDDVKVHEATCRAAVTPK